MSFLSGTEEIITTFNAFAEKHHLKEIAFADHIGFRCESHETFVSIRESFERESAYIYQSIIAGRPIAIIKLTNSLETNLGSIKYVELADQKPDGSQSKGFDHIEIVPKDISYKELKERLEAAGEKVIEKVRPHHTTWDIQMPGLIVRLEEEPLIEKIKREEMN